MRRIGVTAALAAIVGVSAVIPAQAVEQQADLVSMEEFTLVAKGAAVSARFTYSCSGPFEWVDVGGSLRQVVRGQVQTAGWGSAAVVCDGATRTTEALVYSDLERSPFKRGEALASFTLRGCLYDWETGYSCAEDSLTEVVRIR